MVLDKEDDGDSGDDKSVIVKNEQVYEENYELHKVQMWDCEKISDWSHRVNAYTEEQKKFY
jgi:hypothetical protein